MSTPPLPGARAGRDPARAIRRGPGQMPPEQVAANQRDRLHDGLVQTVARKGYTDAKVSDICLAAGVTRPVFYALFAGKEDAFLSAYRYGTTTLLSIMDDAYAAAGDWQSGVRAALRVLLDVLASVPAFAMMAIVEIDAAGPAARAARDRTLADLGRFFADAPAPADAAATGELVGAVVGGAYATIRRHIVTGRAADLGELLPVLGYFVVAPFAGSEAARAELRSPAGEERAAASCAARNRARTQR